MVRRAGGIGFTALVVVMAIVLLLAVRGWAEATSTTVPDTPSGASESAPARQRSLEGLPDLDAMRDATAAHGADLQQALAPTPPAADDDNDAR